MCIWAHICTCLCTCTHFFLKPQCSCDLMVINTLSELWNRGTTVSGVSPWGKKVPFTLCQICLGRYLHTRAINVDGKLEWSSENSSYPSEYYPVISVVTQFQQWLEHPVGTFQDLPSFFIIPSLTMFKPFNQNVVQVIGIHGSFPILASWDTETIARIRHVW